jgi:hypothetical protein
MSFRFRRASIGFAAPLLIACITTEPSGDEQDGSGAATASGATAGAPSAVAGTPGAGVGGSAGSSLGVSGMPGSPEVGGMTGIGGVAPGLGGAGADASGGLAGGVGGLAASAGGAPAAGMSGGGTGGDITAGTGGDATAGMGGTVGGAGMSGGAGAASGCSDGCAELSVPFTTWNAGQYFEIYLNGATDLSTAVISVKARKVAGKAGGLLIVVKDGSAQEYAYAQGAWNAINDMTTAFTTFTLDVASPSMTDENHTFTPTAVQIITVQLAAGDPWYTDDTETMEDPAALVNPTVIQIDEISIAGTGTLPGPWTFTTDASALKATITDDGVNASPPYAVTGSTVTWIAP